VTGRELGGSYLTMFFQRIVLGLFAGCRKPTKGGIPVICLDRRERRRNGLNSLQFGRGSFKHDREHILKGRLRKVGSQFSIWRAEKTTLKSNISDGREKG